MEFQYFDSSGCGFPKPNVPILPPPTRQSFGGKRHRSLSESSRIEGSFIQMRKSLGARTYSRGRYALYEAYRLASVGKSGALLAPSYHCITMLDPALRLNAEIDLYPLLPDLSPDLDAIAKHLRSRRTPAKALLATHYFGFPQEFSALATLCAEHGISLIEDCSHALFSSASKLGNEAVRALGETGQYAIASPYKFFSTEDGGFFWTNDGAQAATEAQRQPSPIVELKGALSAFRRTRESLPLPEIDSIVSEINAVTRGNRPMGIDIRRENNAPSNYYQPPQEGVRSLISSRWIIRHTDVTRLANNRRRNYQLWVAAVAGLPHCRPLLPHLPKDCVPYMFPLFIENASARFNILKHLGLPVWRWDEMATSSCSVAASYRLNLLHLPCHQELTAEQMSWMTSVVSHVMRTQLIA